TSPKEEWRDSMATQLNGRPSGAERYTGNTLLNRSASGEEEKSRAAKDEERRRSAAEAQEEDRRKYEAAGLIANRRYEFQDAKKKSSWVNVGDTSATFVDKAGKPFLSMRFAALWEVLKVTGDGLEKAVKRYESSDQFRERQVKQYYEVFRPGNELARNELSSGQFRYEISMQHLADSISNELDHVFKILGLTSLEEFVRKLADKNPGMECWGTTIQNLLKARGVVPPTLTREQFEKNYAPMLAKLPVDYRKALYGSLS